MSNLVLIGMPACGKSTLGVMTAKALGWNFLDTDVFIQHSESRTLKHIIANDGLKKFRDLENKYVCGLNLDHCVIATGGSVVFGPEAMAHLNTIGHVVWLNVSLETLQRRIGDIVECGVLHQPGQTLADIFQEREHLYRQYADTILDCDGKSADALVRDLVDLVSA